MHVPSVLNMFFLNCVEEKMGTFFFLYITYSES